MDPRPEMLLIFIFGSNQSGDGGTYVHGTCDNANSLSSVGHLSIIFFPQSFIPIVFSSCETFFLTWTLVIVEHPNRAVIAQSATSTSLAQPFLLKAYSVIRDCWMWLKMDAQKKGGNIRATQCDCGRP